MHAKTRKKAQAPPKALKRAKAKMRFYQHLLLYVSVSVLLVFVNFSITPENLWFPIPVAAWGVLVGLHWLLAMNPFRRIDV